MSRIYTTIKDLRDAEIIDALNGVGENFPVDKLVDELRERGLIVYREFDGRAQDNGFELVTDENGETPGFWELVAALDAE